MKALTIILLFILSSYLHIFAQSNESAKFNIVFTELMIDPTPFTGLPAYEYIEIYNRSDKPISLLDWEIQIGNNSKTLPDTTILAGEYIIITNQNNYENYLNYGKVIPVKSLAALNNEGQLIKILNEDSVLIDFVSYNTSWYNDKIKVDGGWSLEKIDPNYFCNDLNNWTASINYKGGTPCQINSVNNNINDTQELEVLRLGLDNDSSIIVYFNKFITDKNIINQNNWIINKELNPICCTIDEIHPSIVYLKFDYSFIKNTSYVLEFNGDLNDCYKEGSHSFRESICLPDSIVFNDIIIAQMIMLSLLSYTTIQISVWILLK